MQHSTGSQELLDAIGNTPLIRLRGPSEATGCDIYGKAEFMNPGGSVKDRAALAIIEDAEERGDRDGFLPLAHQPRGGAWQPGRDLSLGRRPGHVGLCAPRVAL